MQHWIIPDSSSIAISIRSPQPSICPPGTRLGDTCRWIESAGARTEHPMTKCRVSNPTDRRKHVCQEQRNDIGGRSNFRQPSASAKAQAYRRRMTSDQARRCRLSDSASGDLLFRDSDIGDSANTIATYDLRPITKSSRPSPFRS